MNQPTNAEICSHHFSGILSVGDRVFAWTEPDFVQLLHQTATQAGLVVVRETAFCFANGGVSAVVLLAESHIALHFWPELGKVTIDIHVCDFQNYNAIKAQQVTERLTAMLCDRPATAEWHYFKMGEPRPETTAQHG
jgi:S-adenosylmethionine decarboxylase